MVQSPRFMRSLAPHVFAEGRSFFPPARIRLRAFPRLCLPCNHDGDRFRGGRISQDNDLFPFLGDGVAGGVRDFVEMLVIPNRGAERPDLSLTVLGKVRTGRSGVEIWHV